MSLLRHVATLMICLAVGSADAVDFVNDVRPIFRQHCYSCHGAEKQKSGLRLDIRSKALNGGDGYGPSIVAGNPDESPILQLVCSEDPDSRMPPEGPGLSNDDIERLREWIQAGAAWPDGADDARLSDPSDHWAFKPVVSRPIPDVREPPLARNPIDRWILARLEQDQLTIAPEAEPTVWLRRVALDLTGLPPTREEIESFRQSLSLSDSVAKREAIYRRVVDQLLASPRYGERWAQHWLDVVRYAETHGFEVNTERPHAWPYRDYVIHAFNQDTPYDQFVREQIIGDLSGVDAATGFLITASVLLPAQIGQDETSKRLARQDAIDEIVVNIGQTILGLSIGCARCHDHKFDPISTRDYYAMQAFVAGVEYADRRLNTPEARQALEDAKVWRERVEQIDEELIGLQPLASPKPAAESEAAGSSSIVRASLRSRLNVDRFTPRETRRVKFTILKTNSLEPCLDEVEIFDTAGTNRALAASGTRVTSSGDNDVKNRHELRFLNDGKYGNSRSWMSNEVGAGWVEFEMPEPCTIDRVAWGRDRKGEFFDRLATEYRIEVMNREGQWEVVADASDRAPYDEDASRKAPSAKDIAGLSGGLTEEQSARATQLVEEKKVFETKIREATENHLVFAGTFRDPDRIRVLSRGDPEQPKDDVNAAILKQFGGIELGCEAPESQRRQALADWLADPSNPLTARVMVNRIWQGHFGIGLVETPSDFGMAGARPSHPELLDYLASRWMREGWSIKDLHRAIVLSATYRQAVRLDERARSIDRDNRLLWSYPARRLDAETIRDAMMQASGRLNLKMGGRGFDLFDKRGGLSGFVPVETFGAEGSKRLIYAHRVRRERDAVFGAYDCPDAGQSTARRRESTTPIQALNLFNSRFTLDASQALATRARLHANDDLATEVQWLFEETLSRAPTPDELTELKPIVAEQGLEALCRALFNSNEFLFLP